MKKPVFHRSLKDTLPGPPPPSPKGTSYFTYKKNLAELGQSYGTSLTVGSTNLPLGHAPASLSSSKPEHFLISDGGQHLQVDGFNFYSHFTTYKEQLMTKTPKGPLQGLARRALKTARKNYVSTADIYAQAAYLTLVAMCSHMDNLAAAASAPAEPAKTVAGVGEGLAAVAHDLDDGENLYT